MNVYLGFDSLETMWTKCYPSLYPMWYVRDLLVALTVSPILYWVLKLSPWGLLGIFFLYLILDIPTSSFFFVSVGIFVALYGKNFLFGISNSYIRFFIVTTAVIVFACSMVGYKWTSMPGADLFRSLITMLAVFMMTRNFDFSRLTKLGKCSYFIFAFHPFLIEVFLKVHYTRLSIMSVDLTIPYAILYLLFPILIYCIGYYMDKAIKNYSPFLSRLLCVS